jgi:pyroglutamyl-peptidase
MAGRAILVTGFQPYGGRGRNPAHEIMAALDGRSIAGRPVIGRPLSVSLARLPDEIAGLLEAHDPAAVVSLGLWPGESMIRIERMAVNIADFEIADNEGSVVTDAAISANGAAALAASLPLRAIERAILDAGIPARLSATAGTFLCNACLYSFLEALAERSPAVPCGFLHVPYMPEQVAERLAAARPEHGLELHQRSDLASMSLDRMVKAVELAVAETARALEASAAPPV